MSPTTTRLIEHLAHDGPIRPLLAVVLAVALLAVFAWSLWRERIILGPRCTVLFWLLRAAALGTVLWMLLAPVTVRVETSTTRRAVAVVTDISRSMQTVDPVGTSDDARWSVATQPGKVSLTGRADRAVAAMGMAEQHLASMIAAINRHQSEPVIAGAAAAVSNDLQHVRDHVGELRSMAHNRSSLHVTELPLSRLEEKLSGPELQAFDRLANALLKGRTPSETGWRESLPDLQYRLVSIRRELRELATMINQSPVSEVDPSALSKTQTMSRFSRVAALMQRLESDVWAELRETADVQLSVFDDSLRQLDAAGSLASIAKSHQDAGSTAETSAGSASTDLSAPLQRLNQDRKENSLAAVFLLTDAAHNQPDAPDPRSVAGRFKNTPVYIIPVGNTQHVRDVILQSVYAPTVAMRNDDIVIEVSLQAHDCEGEICTVQLLQDGDVVDFREVVIDSSIAGRTVRFEQQMPAVGQQQFQVAVIPLEGELTDENNYGEFEVNVTRSDLKILLADEMPRWEYRYLSQLFRRDAKVECDELLFHPRMIATGRREDSKTVPITLDEWDQYDVVLLGDLAVDHFPVVAQESMAQYLKQRGGTVVIIAGQDAMPHAYVDHPLEEVIPVLPLAGSATTPAGGYAFRVTEAGRKHHALMIGETEEATRNAWDFVNRFAPLHEVSRWRQPRPSAETLISAVHRNALADEKELQQSAFLCWQPVGRGKVVYLSGPDTYRLRFLRGDRLHFRFWGQLLRWAIATDLSAGSEYIRVRTDKTRYRLQEAVQITVRLTDADGEPVVTDGLSVQAASAEHERTVPLIADPSLPGEYRAEVTSLPPGVYQVEPTGVAPELIPQTEHAEPATASLTVQSQLPREMVDTRCDRALAQQIAGITGGQVLPPTAIEEILALTDLNPIVTEQIERRPLWLEWKYLWIVFGCLQFEWVMRKWKGLS